MAADPEDPRPTALRLLTRREYSQAELARRLREKGFPVEAVTACVEVLAAKRLISDERFVESFITSRTSRGQGPVRIRAELRERGVEESLIEAGLAGVEVDWLSLAAAERRKKFGAKRPADYRERAKQARFLQYRGFTADQIRPVLGEDWE